MTEDELLFRAIDLLCGAASGFVPGSMPDVEWQNAKDKLLRDHCEYKRALNQQEKTDAERT